MTCAPRDRRAVRDELEQLLSNPLFTRAERASKLLRFLVERCLEGRDSELKESTIGVEVFGRTADYDPKLDSIVRTEAVRLRARLAKYYASDGVQDPVVIELPKGGYVACFRHFRSPPDARGISRRRQLWFVLSVAAIVVATVTLGIGWRLRTKPAVPIAVVPLVNLSQNPETGYFADGLTDEIIRNLSVIDGLAVRSRTSSFALKGKAQSAREIGREMAADYILEGSVLPAGEQLRIDVQFVRVRDDFPIWAYRFDKRITDVFEIQDEISRAIVNNLRLKLGRGRRRYEINSEAYDLYLHGRALSQNCVGQNDDRAISAFQQAIAKDPSFAPAYAALSAAYAYRSGLFSRDPTNELPKMQTAAKRALELDPLLAEAHDALGTAYAREAKWQESEVSFRRAIELDPNSSEVRDHFALYLLWPLGRTAEAIRQLYLAEEADPLSSRIQAMLGYVLPSAGEYEKAASHCEKVSPDFPLRSDYLGRARLLQGRTAEATQILEAAFQKGVPPGSEVRAFLGLAYARTGRRAEAEKLADTTNAFNQAVIFLGLGDKERAIEAMERSTAAGPVRVGRQLCWPELASIRDEPRMRLLRQQLGLP